MRFKAFQDLAVTKPLIVVDLGYSESRASCGLTWTGRPNSRNHRFSVALRLIAEQIQLMEEPILVIEAPLSGCHNAQGNPTLRGSFEEGRAWYCQPAATTCLASIRLMHELSNRLTTIPFVWVAEAFLSDKDSATPHHHDASLILNAFSVTRPIELKQNTHPISPFLDGIPSVRVVTAN